MNERTESILKTVRELPQHTVTATLRSPRGSSTRAYKGALLYDYTRAVGMTPLAPSVGFGNYYFVARAEDGFTIILAYFEVTPRATAKQVLLAYEQDGEALRVGLRLIVPGDDLGGRSISGVVDIEMKSTPSAELQSTRPWAESLRIGGNVENPASLSLEDLAALPQTEVVTQETPRHGSVMAPARRYQGVLLWQLLEKANVIVDPNINEDIMRRIVVARSTDGYAAVIAPGEVDPRFMGGEVLVATACEGVPLGPNEGHFRLVVGYDKAIGRMIKSLASIEVLEG